jgi:hypothetical protein
MSGRAAHRQQTVRGCAIIAYRSLHCRLQWFAAAHEKRRRSRDDSTAPATARERVQCAGEAALQTAEGAAILRFAMRPKLLSQRRPPPHAHAYAVRFRHQAVKAPLRACARCCWLTSAPSVKHAARSAPCGAASPPRSRAWRRAWRRRGGWSRRWRAPPRRCPPLQAVRSASTTAAARAAALLRTRGRHRPTQRRRRRLERGWRRWRLQTLKRRVGARATEHARAFAPSAPLR